MQLWFFLNFKSAPAKLLSASSSWAGVGCVHGHGAAQVLSLRAGRIRTARFPSFREDYHFDICPQGSPLWGGGVYSDINIKLI